MHLDDRQDATPQRVATVTFLSLWIHARVPQVTTPCHLGHMDGAPLRVESIPARVD